MEHGGIAGDTEIFGLFVGIFGTESMYYFGDPLADKSAELAEPSLFAGNNPADNIGAIAALGIEAGPGCENLPRCTVEQRGGQRGGADVKRDAIACFAAGLCRLPHGVGGKSAAAAAG